MPRWGITSSLNDKATLVKFNSMETHFGQKNLRHISGSFYTARQCRQTKDKGYIIVAKRMDQR